MDKLRPQQIGMMAAAAITLALWLIPGAHLLTLPLQYLNTHLHEMGHALAAVFTGGSVQDIIVRGDGSGVTHAYASHWVIIGSAGYLGASCMGAALIAFSRNEKSARYALLGVAAILAIEDILWLRGDAIGMVSGFAYLMLFLILGLALRGWAAILVAQFVGLQQCLAALQAVFVLVNPHMLAFTDSDATILQGMTGVPAILWAVGWAGLSAALMLLTFASAWREPRRAPRLRAAAR